MKDFTAGGFVHPLQANVETDQYWQDINQSFKPIKYNFSNNNLLLKAETRSSFN